MIYLKNGRKSLCVLGGAANIQPVLPPPLVELAPANQLAPPVAIELLIDRKLSDTVPVGLLSVWVAAVILVMVISFPAVPLTLNALVIVVVVAAVKASVRALEASEKLIVLKVFEPVMSSSPVEPATV